MRPQSGSRWVLPRLGLERAGRHRTSRQIAAPTAQDHRGANSDQRPGHRPGDVDPIGRKVAADQGRAEGAGGIHRDAADRRRPEAREGDVAADAERGDRADVLRRRGSPENDADQTAPSARSPSGTPASSRSRDPAASRPGARRCRRRRAGRGRQGSPRELDDDVAGQTFPGEVAAQGESKGHGRIEVRAGDGTHEEDDRHDHQPGRHHRRRQADLALCVEKAAAGGDEHQHEGAEQLREQPAVREARIVEVGTSDPNSSIQRCRTLRIMRRDASRARSLGRGSQSSVPLAHSSRPSPQAHSVTAPAGRGPTRGRPARSGSSSNRFLSEANYV